MRSPYPEFVLTNIICIEKALKGTEIVFVLTVFLLTRFYCSLKQVLAVMDSFKPSRDEKSCRVEFYI